MKKLTHLNETEQTNMCLYDCKELLRKGLSYKQIDDRLKQIYQDVDIIKTLEKASAIIKIVDKKEYIENIPYSLVVEASKNKGSVESVLDKKDLFDINQIYLEIIKSLK